MTDLELDRLLVIYPGDQRYALHGRVDAVPIGELATDPTALIARRT